MVTVNIKKKKINMYNGTESKLSVVFVKLFISIINSMLKIYSFVNITGPFFVIKIVCSNWAVVEPSFEM